ncbi:putative peptide ABC transporter substrate-binding protein [Agrobacterium rubi TR3 = NBRC 13261]|uniref:Putative peptide ABC transporter substrate-binding protein n=1 Tax=Agrobacterium rubi TR3 = NBRC 13261 TaxID=1368415 RepID=A0A081CV24_9HYPH|nr:extracellular solute-binding protein [Agrobacterium rubi]MBP1879376.1 microcin C transport system substrate-binding protein [Agrobacterium rubi]GAK70520.1 putative peptide ABC transporter substrate-binding protein [Agrobacterium rubi TR3 = NBRC 13261]
MALAKLKSGVLALAALSCVIAPIAARAQDSENWRSGISTVGELKHPNGFKHFDYVNPNAPKGGTLRMSTTGTFDTLNPVLVKGEVGTGIAVVFDTLFQSSEEELSSSYGLLAEGVSFPDDISKATFRLRKEAKWADGKPVMPEDVVFSFEKSKDLSPQMATVYAHVVKAEVTGERDVTFSFDEKGNRELPQIVGQLAIVPKHWWEGNGPDGKPRDISRGTLEPVMGSGPYKITSVNPGSTITYERRDDYWGKDINVNVGQNNFKTITYAFFADQEVQFQAFKSGNIDFWQEQSSSRWVTGYDVPAVKDGRIKKEELPNIYRSIGIMQAMVPNERREKFQNPKLRQALNYAFDFEDLNKTLAYGSFTRINSFFMGSELASSGLPTGRELEVLQELKDQVPPEVFTQEYRNPVGGDPAKQRDNLREAVRLMKEAGYELRGNRMVNAKTGEQLSIELLSDSAGMERTILPFVQNLKKIGINATIRTVDASQYTNRQRSFDFDVVIKLWVTLPNPGNEQADYWGSAAADRQGSGNLAGIKNPAVDALVRKIILAPNRDEQVAAARALDRVLLFNHYVIPQFYKGEMFLAHWNTLVQPENLPEYGIGFPGAWWSANAGK